MARCLTCNGTGRARVQAWGSGVLMNKYDRCGTCGGSGREQLASE